MPFSSLIPAPLRPALREAYARLSALYGGRLRRVILYGSHARGDAHADSDVDLLVVLRGEMPNAYQEIKRVVRIELALFERYGLDVSISPYSESAWNDLQRPFIQNVRAEGLVLSEGGASLNAAPAEAPRGERRRETSP